MLKPGKLYLLNLSSVRLKFVFRRVQLKIKLFRCGMFLFKTNLFSEDKWWVETKPNAHSAKFIYSLSFLKPCVVRTWWSTWSSKIQAKLRNLENHILLLIQVHIGDTDSNSPYKRTTNLVHFLFPVYMIARFWWSLITSLAKYGHRSYFKWYRQKKAITEGLKVCRFFFLSFFSPRI